MPQSNKIIKKLGKQLYLTPGLILGMLFVVFAATSAGRELHAQLLGIIPLPAWHIPGTSPFIQTLLTSYLPQYPLAVAVAAVAVEEVLFTALGGILLTRQLPALKPAVAVALLVMARSLYYLPVGMLAIFSVPLWALLLARFYQQTRAFLPVLAAHIAANLGVHQYSGETSNQIWWNQQILPLLLVVGALWVVIHFAPQVTFKTGRRKRIDLTNTWEDGWLSKALLWSMTVYATLSIGFFVVSGIYASITGRRTRPIPMNPVTPTTQSKPVFHTVVLPFRFTACRSAILKPFIRKFHHRAVAMMSPKVKIPNRVLGTVPNTSPRICCDSKKFPVIEA